MPSQATPISRAPTPPAVMTQFDLGSRGPSLSSHPVDPPIMRQGSKLSGRCKAFPSTHRASSAFILGNSLQHGLAFTSCYLRSILGGIGR